MLTSIYLFYLLQDLLSLPQTQDYIIIELDYSWSFASGDNRIDFAMQNTYTGLNSVIEDFVDSGHLPDVYRPLFMNDAYFRQDYWGRIAPESREMARRTRERYDPEGFFQKRTSGGFRLG